MKFGLKDRVVLVTGGSRGIGAAICKAMAAEGARVAVNFRAGKTAAEAVAQQIRETPGGHAVAIQADMGDEAQILSMFEEIGSALGPVDVLVNNAATCPSGPATSYSCSDWENTFRINMTGAFIAGREHVRRMLESGRKGSIVNVVSAAAFLGSTTGHLPYDASKGALVSFTIALAREMGPHGIRVNAVAPGMTRTEMIAKTWEKNKERYLARIPLNRIAEPEEIAAIVVFLASDAASYITGATIDASGGLLMH